MLRQPWRLPLLAWRLGLCWLRLAARSRRHRDADVVLVGYLGHFDVVLARLLLRRTPIALDHLVSAADTARDRGESGRLKGTVLQALDRLATRCADVVVVDTEEHLALLSATARAKAVVAAVGAQPEWFDARMPADAAGDSHPLRVVFFGQFTPLQGTTVIAGALGRLDPDQVQASLIGSGQDFDAAREAAAGAPVDWLGWVEPEELPGVVASYDVCLGIFGTGPKAQRVVPNKVYQGAAAGCALVTSDTAPQRRALGSAAVFVPPGDAGSLADALQQLAKDRARVAELREQARSRADAGFTPAAVAAPVRERLTRVVRPGRARAR
jgi:glycosyltransferase involved in cell wall biosynthesis